MHFYNFNVKDFNSSTRHLTHLERALFRDLIDMYYVEEKAITSNITILERKLLVHTEEERQALKNVLADFFTLKALKGDGEERYHIKRIDREIKNYRHRQATSSSEHQVTSSETSNEHQENIKPKDVHYKKVSMMVNALKNKGIKANMRMKMADLQALFDEHCNQTSSEHQVTSSEHQETSSECQVPFHKSITNNHKPLTNNQEPITTISKPQANVPAGYVLYKTDDDNEYSLFDLEQVYENVYADFIEQAKASYVTIVLSEQQYREMFDKMRQWSLEKKDTRTPQKWMNTWLSWVNNNAYKFNNPKTTHAKTATATTSYDSKNVNKAWDSVPKVEYTAEQIAQFKAESDAISKELNLI